METIGTSQTAQNLKKGATENYTECPCSRIVGLPGRAWMSRKADKSRRTAGGFRV